MSDAQSSSDSSSQSQAAEHEDPPGPAGPSDPRGTKRKRAAPQPRPTVFSAVAGHITSRPTASAPATRPSRKPLPPADALFERLGAPDRFAEPQLDWYGAHRWLDAHGTTRADVYADGTLRNEEYRIQWDAWEEPGGLDARMPGVRLRDEPSIRANAARKEEMGLPNSDLCKALHRYACAFYTVLEQDAGRRLGGEASEARSGVERGTPPVRKPVVSSFQSFDETALLAFAILLEETTKRMVRSRLPTEGEGWRALTVGLDEDDQEVPSECRVKRTRKKQSEARVASSSRIEEDGSDVGFDAQEYGHRHNGGDIKREHAGKEPRRNSHGQDADMQTDTHFDSDDY